MLKSTHLKLGPNPNTIGSSKSSDKRNNDGSWLKINKLKLIDVFAVFSSGCYILHSELAL